MDFNERRRPPAPFLLALPKNLFQVSNLRICGSKARHQPVDALVLADLSMQILWRRKRMEPCAFSNPFFSSFFFSHEENLIGIAFPRQADGVAFADHLLEFGTNGIGMICEFHPEVIVEVGIELGGNEPTL